MDHRFDTTYSNLGNENSVAGYIKCSPGPHLTRGPQVPHPVPGVYKRHSFNFHRPSFVVLHFFLSTFLCGKLREY